MQHSLKEEPLLIQLRHATREQHNALEAVPLLRALLSDRLNLEHYLRVLRSMADFYQDLEAGISDALDSLFEAYPSAAYSYFPRLPLLTGDLADLDAPLPCANHSRSLISSTPDNHARTVGILYVIEGATQGGKLISRHLKSSLDVHGEYGARYFNCHRYGSWPAFCSWFENSLPGFNPADLAEGARDVFAGLRVRLETRHAG